MLAEVAEKPFDGAGWLFEVKWDGYRAIAEVEAGKVRLYSRNGLDLEAAYPPVVSALAQLGHDAIIDGEVVVLDERGRSSFQLLQGYGKSRKGPLVYYAFDLLALDGVDQRGQPLAVRKQRLQEILPASPHLRISEHVEEKGKAFFQAAAQQGLEGVMAKRAASTYQEGKRSRDWRKIKAKQTQSVVIGGFTQPRGQRKEFGSLVLGVYEGDKLIYAGHAGTGFTEKILADLRARLEPLVRPTCPFTQKPKSSTPARWVEPKLVCEVEFQNWTEDGSMRHPVYMGLRPDKAPRSVSREALNAPLPAAARQQITVPLTNLDKIYWPDEGYTKRDLIEYYRAAAPLLVPHLKDRPMSLNRHPNGILGKNFFQKNMSRQPPPSWVTTTTIKPDDGAARTQLLCQNEETLIYLANLGCIELNPWNSRVASLERPDYLVIDLDPHEAPFALAVDVARATHRLLEKVGAACYCKTSGKRGLHVYLPLAARYHYDLVRQVAEIIAILVHRALPEQTSLVRDPNRRRGKVYIDFLQNRRGQTTAAPYSARPVAGAPVSTPLQWSEVTKKLDPRRFTIRTAPKRFDKLGDLWQGVLGPGVDLAKCVQALQTQA